jgi:O-succinylbenzoic acid--CoA ligase
VELLRPSADAATTVAALRDWLEADRPAPLLIETSGSSGRPKRVVLSRDAVLASARATERRLGGSGPWALALPSSYVAGVQVVVRSLLAGHRPVLDGWGAARFTSLVPTQLHRLLARPDDTAALAAMDAVLLGGSPIDPDLRRRAEDARVRVVATYGSSETAGGCVYDGVPLDGVAVAVGAEGRIRIAGPVLFDGYDGDPALTAASLVGGWFLTSDAGRLDEDGRLQVLGRLDDVVVSGGVKVPLPAVAARLREHPDVAAAEVLGVEDPEWGQRVVAFVVVISTSSTTGERPSQRLLRDWVAERHPRSWAPRDVVVVDALPLLANGKVDRAALRKLA